ncbi:hypothetical protein [Streptomyces phage phiScoe1]|nr:hypothetical protein [Streptomyces phage phiScoe1]
MKMPRQLSARVDSKMARQIRTLRYAGLSYSQMVKWGVALLADVYAAAWEHKVVHLGETPELQSYIFKPNAYKFDGPPWADEEDTNHEEEPADRVPGHGRAGLPRLELAGLRLAGPEAEAGDAPDQGEVHPRVPSADAAVC